jgi:hypothetical protein
MVVELKELRERRLPSKSGEARSECPPFTSGESKDCWSAKNQRIPLCCQPGRAYAKFSRRSFANALKPVEQPAKTISASAAIIVFSSK